jgi:serpin B
MVIGLVLIASLAMAAAAENAATPPKEPTPAMKTLAGEQNAFAVDLYARLQGQEGNLFFSPYSISTALTMTWAGAGGDTAGEMAKALHLPGEKDQAGAAIQASADLQNRLQAVGGGKFQLNVANALWGQQGYPFKDAYIGLIKANFGGGLEQVDFAQAEKTRLTINKWVEVQTKDKIKDLIGAGMLSPATRLVLTNAIYFKAVWADKFDKKATKKEPFHLAPGKTVQAELMDATRQYSLGQGDGAKVLEMPYAGLEVSMVIVLPDKPDGLAAVEKGLSAEKLTGWLGKLQGREVHLRLPRFKATKEFMLASELQALGVKLAFDSGKADFSGMAASAKEPLFIGEVIHKAFVDVNEEGTEAAAATAVMMFAGAAPREPEKPVEFIADHPFLFLIRDNRTGCILFMGRLANPKA